MIAAKSVVDGIRDASAVRRAEIYDKGISNPKDVPSLFARLAEKIDKAIAVISNDAPAVLPWGDSGCTVTIYHRLGTPESSRWIKLPDGQMTVARSSDIIHVRDVHGNLVERKRIADSPRNVTVFPEGAPLQDSVIPN